MRAGATPARAAINITSHNRSIRGASVWPQRACSRWAGAAKRRRSAAPSGRSRTTPPISRATGGTRRNEIIIMTRHSLQLFVILLPSVLTTHEIMLTLKGEMQARDSILFDRRRRCDENSGITYIRKGTYNSYVQQYYSKLVTEKIAIQYVQRAS